SLYYSLIFIYVYYRTYVSRHLYSFPTRRSSDSEWQLTLPTQGVTGDPLTQSQGDTSDPLTQSQGDTGDLLSASQGDTSDPLTQRSEEHTSELQSRENLVCRLLLEKKKRQASIT